MMKATDRSKTKAADRWHAGKVLAVHRLFNSVNGNPRFCLTIDRYTHTEDIVTSSDSMCAYNVENVTRGIRQDIGVDVQFRLTRAGRIWDIRRYVSE